MPPYDPWPKGSNLIETMLALHDATDQSWRFTKKGDTRPWEDVEAMKASRRKNITAKREAAIDKNLAEVRARLSTMRPTGTSIVDRMLQAMEPGEWYGAGDLARMVGESREARGKVSQVMLKRGWVEVAQNATWGGPGSNLADIMGGAEPNPKRLYRLTLKGSQIRETRQANLAGL